MAFRWRSGTSSAEVSCTTISRLGRARPDSRKLTWRCDTPDCSASASWLAPRRRRQARSMGPNRSGWGVGWMIDMALRLAPPAGAAITSPVIAGGALWGEILPRPNHPKEDVMNASDRLLRRTLWGNAVFSVISGAVLVACATPFAGWATHEPLSVAGLDLAIVFELLGLGVVLFGALCGWAASRETLPRGLARVIFIADIAW